MHLFEFAEKDATLYEGSATQSRNTGLDEPQFPFIENPLIPTEATETPVTPLSLNLPAPDTSILAGTNNNLANLSTAQKLAILFNQN